MRQPEPEQSIARSLQIAGVFIFVAALYLARDVLIPVSLGMLVAFALSPLVTQLQRRGLSSTMAVIAAAAVVPLAIGVFLVSIGSSVAGFTEELPKYRVELRNKVENARELVAGLGARFRDISNAVDGSSNSEDANAAESDSASVPSITSRILGMADEGETNDGSTPKKPLYVVDSGVANIDLKSWAGGAAAILGPVGTAGLVSVFALFGLLYREDLRDRVVSVVAQGNYVVTTEALNEASQRIGKYLVAQLVLNVSYGVLFSIGLIIIGYFLTEDGWFPYVTVLGTAAGLVRFVPYIGPLIGAGLPLTLAMLLFPGFQVVTAVALLIITMELVFNNVLEPWLYGSSTGVSPMAVIVAAVFWGWLWGPIGLLLATPLTVCAVVLGQYVPRFRFLSMLLSDEIQVKTSVRAYQRLLSGEQHRVSEFIRAQASSLERVQLIDELLVPTVKLIIDDEQKRELSDEQMLKLLHIGASDAGIIAAPTETAEMRTEEKPDLTVDSDAKEPPAQAPLAHVIAVPVRNAGEQLVLEAIGHHLEESLRITVFENDDLPDRDAQRLSTERPQAIVIGVIPPGGMEQARYWCSSLRKAGFRGDIIVACFGKFKNYDLLLQSYRKRGANQLVTSASQLVQKIARIGSRFEAQHKLDSATDSIHQLERKSHFHPSKPVLSE